MNVRPYDKMVLKNETLAEFRDLNLDLDYSLKFKLKNFMVQLRDGSIKKRGPCLSIQLFSNGHYLKAISLRVEELLAFIKHLTLIHKQIKDLEII